MMGFTGESFTPEQLEASQRSLMYFNEQCTYSFLSAPGEAKLIYSRISGRLKPLPPKMRGPFAELIRNYRELEEKDMQETVALMHRCLRLDPADRPSADELLLDPWWAGVE
jgi:serine/threonine-protein kinase SRPK3